MTGKKIDSFQGLRAIVCVAIFISHSGLGSFGALGAWGVSVFFVLSGFLMMYNYLQREADPKFGLRFAQKKIKSLYPLHIAMMVVAFLYLLLSHSKTTESLTKALPLHALLVQIWIPNPEYYATLNGVSWYLSAITFLYFCFPIILKLFRKIDIKSVILILVGGYL